MSEIGGPDEFRVEHEHLKQRIRELEARLTELDSFVRELAEWVYLPTSRSGLKKGKKLFAEGTTDADKR